MIRILVVEDSHSMRSFVRTALETALQTRAPFEILEATSGFDALHLKGVTLEITPLNVRNQVQIVDVAAPHSVHPGEDLEVSVVLSGQNGGEALRKTKYHVPVGAPAGTLYLTVSDATTANLTDYQNALLSPPRSSAQVFGLLNGLRSSASAYLRVWRAGNAFTVDGRDLPDPPASTALILGRNQQGGANLASARGARLTEIEIPLGQNAVGGSKTIQVEVKE